MYRTKWNLKPILTVLVALSIVVGGFGLATVSASEQQPDGTALYQDSGSGWLGVGVQDAANGAEIVDVVSGSPADEAGLRTGDVITSVDETAIDSATALVEALGTYAPGDDVTITAEWRGDAREYAVTLGERPADLDQGQPTPPSSTMPGVGFGMLNFLGLDASLEEDGLHVNGIDADSPLADSGLQEGDVITSIGGLSADDLRNPRQLLELLQQGGTLDVVVERDGEEVTLSFDLPGLGDIELPDDLDFDFDFGPGMMGDIEHMALHMLGVQVSLTDEGLQIDSLDADSPLADTGLQAGDVVTAVNGVSLVDPDLGALVDAVQNAETLTLTVMRDGEEQEVEIDLSSLDLPDFQFMPMTPDDMPFGMMQPPTQLGVQYRILTADVAAEEGLDAEEGALIEEVYDGTPAAEAGLQTGDIVTAVDGDAVDQANTLSDRLSGHEEGDVVTLTVLRDGEEQAIEVTLGPAPTLRQFSFRTAPGQRMPFGGQNGRNGRGPNFNFRDDMRQGMEDFFKNHPFLDPRSGSDDAQPQPAVPQQNEDTPAGQSA